VPFFRLAHDFSLLRACYRGCSTALPQSHLRELCHWSCISAIKGDITITVCSESNAAGN